MKSKCFSFEPSGHHYRPLDGINGFVLRLYCPRCGRISLASTDNNTAYWDVTLMPSEAVADYLANLPSRKPDA